ncbi:hypothetical protein As57867_017270, partial [Aphanomyces stellatus]
MSGSRYRLYFLGPEIPSTMLQDGRMVEELIFRGRCLRVYGRGWFYRDKRLARLDLDALAVGEEPAKAPTQTPTTPSTDRPSSVSKRQRTDRRDSNGLTSVVRSPRAVVHPTSHTLLAEASPNAFSALIERWSVGYDVYTASHDGVAFSTFVPEPSMLENDHVHPTTGEYVTCQKQHKGKLSRVEVPLDDLIADIQALESQAAAASHYHSSHVEAAVSGSETDLAALVNKGRVDEIGTFMGRHPVDFGIQLHRLFVDDRPTFELLVRQRLLHRWLRATWGGSASFDNLYTKSFGHKMTKDSMVALFSAL